MNNLSDIEWRKTNSRVAYPDALAEMEQRNAAIHAGELPELIWLLEHPPLYTAGTSANPAELLSQQFPVFETGRGGRHTYHGPGQRVGYVMLNLKKRKADVRNFVHALEGWVISALAEFGVNARAVEGRVGIWCDTPQGEEAKIGAIGIRIRKWVTMHGFSVNIDPDLSHFGGIIPCGISEYPVTSLKQLGIDATMEDFDAALKKAAPDFLAAIDKVV
ncbi:lipoyl(octanoyl) transferase LipB [Parasphingorhabdus sp. JC815]|uniref:lipoyl(octanoyl) transferase LipB n=1 Tax=Parasphingorhabdus sp. JC815 TaxID=3232140 RepID=UPI00345A5E3E